MLKAPIPLSHSHAIPLPSLYATHPPSIHPITTSAPSTNIPPPPPTSRQPTSSTYPHHAPNPLPHQSHRTSHPEPGDSNFAVAPTQALSCRVEPSLPLVQGRDMHPLARRVKPSHRNISKPHNAGQSSGSLRTTPLLSYRSSATGPSIPSPTGVQVVSWPPRYYLNTHNDLQPCISKWTDSSCLLF